MTDPGALSAAVSQLTATSGLGSYTLGTPIRDKLLFTAAYIDGEIITYLVTDTSGTSEVTTGVFTSPDSLSRDTLVLSSTGSFIDWPASGQRVVTPLIRFPICDTAPTIGQVLEWDGTEWCPATLEDSSSVARVCPTSPLDGQVLIWSAAENAYCPADFCTLVAACTTTPTTSDAVYFDGFEGKYYTNALTGVFNGPLLSFSFWIKADQSPEDGAPIVAIDSTGNSGNSINWSTRAGHLNIFISDGGSNSFIFNTNNFPVDGAFHNLLCSIDVSGVAKTIVFIDETDFSDSGFAPDGPYNLVAGSNGIALSDFPSSPGRQAFSGTRSRGCIGDFWWAPGQFLDFSVQGNRAKFHDVITLAPVVASALGTTGETPTGVSPALFLVGGTTTFGTNLGTGGSLTADPTVADCLEGLHVSLTPEVTRSGVTFTGTTGQFQFLQNFADPHLFSDSAIGMVSVWLRLGSLPSTLSIFTAIYGGSQKIIDISLDSSGRVVAMFTASDLSTTATFTQTTGGAVADGSWHHLIMSYDTTAGTMQVVNDRVAATVIHSGSTGFTVGITLESPFRIQWMALSGGAGTTGASLTGDAAELWIDPSQNMDLTVSSNLDKFEISAATVSLGIHGEVPTGTAPFAYCSQQPQGYTAITFYDNRALGMTQVAPTISQSATSPSPAPSPYP